MATASYDIQLRNSKKKTSLKEGMNLYDPSHGVGQIMSIEKKTILGETAVFCKLYFSRDDMNMLMPVSQMVDNGIREIISAEEAKKILNSILNKAPKGSKSIWTKRINDFEYKMYSGDPRMLAEVVRDLYVGIRNPNKSYGERALFEKALDRLVMEFSIALGVSFEDANKMILDKLDSHYKAEKSEIDIKDDSGDDGDFNDDDFEDSNNEEENSSKKKKGKKVA